MILPTLIPQRSKFRGEKSLVHLKSLLPTNNSNFHECRSMPVTDHAQSFWTPIELPFGLIQYTIMSETVRRFMQTADVSKEKDPWATVEWLSNDELVGAKELLMVRATIDAGGSPFHRHPTREEIITSLGNGQWVNEYGYSRLAKWPNTARRCAWHLQSLR